MPTTSHQLLEWQHYPVKNGYPWVAFIPGVGWFFLRRVVWADGSPKPWGVLHMPLRGGPAMRDYKGRIRLQQLSRQGTTAEEAAQHAEAYFAEKYPLIALATSFSVRG